MRLLYTAWLTTALFPPILGAQAPLTDFNAASATRFVSSQVLANKDAFYLFDSHDSAYSNYFFSGRFQGAGLPTIDSRTDCIFDAAAPGGCGAEGSSSPGGSAIRMVFPRLQGVAEGDIDYIGIYFESPKLASNFSNGFDVRGSSAIEFEARTLSSPMLAHIEAGEPRFYAQHFVIESTWKRYQLPIPPGCCKNLRIPLIFSANGTIAPNGGTVFLRSIKLDTPPAEHVTAPALPLSFVTLAIPVETVGPRPARVPIPIDQVLRNVAVTADAGTALILLAKDPGQRESARFLADSLIYAIRHDNEGLPIPAGPGTTVARNAYMGGRLALADNQPRQVGAQTAAKAGNVRLPGFSLGSESRTCGEDSFCLVLNGASAEANALTILGLLAASSQFENTQPISQRTYLNGAREIGAWIIEHLADTSGPNGASNFGGYFHGYPDLGLPPQAVLRGKSTAENALLYAAFRALQKAASPLDDDEVKKWTRAADGAAQFIVNMFDNTTGSFYSGTVKHADAGLASGPGVILDGPVRGDDLVNIYDFSDSQALPVLAFLPGAPAGLPADAPGRALDWMSRQIKQISANLGGSSVVLQGLSQAERPIEGPDGITWQATAQALLALRLEGARTEKPARTGLIDELSRGFAAVQRNAPFGDGASVPAATLQGVLDQIRVSDQCMTIPYQCVPARPGLGATVWSIFSKTGNNPLDPAYILTRR